MTKSVPTPVSSRAAGPRGIGLQSALRAMEERQERLSGRRTRNRLLAGATISLIVHLAIMVFLATRYRMAPAGRGPAPVSYEFAILQEEELTELETVELDDLVPEAAQAVDEAADSGVQALDAAVPAAELEIARAGSLPTLGGSGEGLGDGNALGGGGAGTSFFGVSSRGMRFAYIVDRSGSMGEGRKMQIAMRELSRSIESLPDYAFFYVVLFSSDIVEPSVQRGWTRSRRSVIDRLNRWLNEIDPSGGTEPLPAFYQVFALDVRPDVIFFLTDGEIPEETPALVEQANGQGGRRVIINTIAFGDDRSQVLLRRIADDSGGAYRFVSTEGL